MDAGNHDLRGWIGVGLLTTLALALRLARVTEQDLWYDEVNTLYRASAPSLAGLLARIVADVQAPLWDVVMAGVCRAFGTGIWAARVPAAIAGAALVPVAALLVRALAGRWPAVLLAAAYAAASPYLVRYGYEGRPYALLSLASGLALLGTLRLLSTDGRRGVMLFAIGSTLLVLVHYYGALVALALVLVLTLNAGAWGSRLPTVAAAGLAPLLALAAWSPAALYQFSTKDMAAIYGPLDAAMLAEIWDALALHAPRGREPGALVWIGRLLVLGLVLAGLVHLRVRMVRRGHPAASCRRLAITVAAAGVALLATGALLDAGDLGRLAQGLLGKSGGLKPAVQAFLGSVRVLLLALGGGALLVAVLLANLSGLVTRFGTTLSPGAALLITLLVPVLAVLVLDGLGKRTLAPRNMIVLAPVIAVLFGLGLAALPRGARLLILLTCVGLAGWGLTGLSSFHLRPPWRRLGRVVAASGASPLAHPPWLARCVEYHGGRPWDSVFASYRPDVVRAWAADRDAVVFVRAYEWIADPGPIQAVLRERFGTPRVERIERLTAEFYGGG